MNPNPCKHCGKAPQFLPLDVADTASIIHAYHVCRATGEEVKLSTGWQFNREAAVKDWNEQHGTTSQPSHAMSVLMRNKAAMVGA